MADLARSRRLREVLAAARGCHPPAIEIAGRHRRTMARAVVEGGKVHQRKVKLGRRNGTMAQVLSGLTRGERVVVHPTDKVVEGVRVVF